MTSPNPLNSLGPFLEEDFILPVDAEDGLESISERERRTASIVNVREIGIYQVAGLIPGTATVENPEIVNGQQWYRPIVPPETLRRAQYDYRSAFDLVALNAGVAIPADGAPHPFNHGLSPGGGSFTFTRIYGTATKAGPVYMPLPYASPTLNLNIELSVTNTQIVITVGAGQTALTQCYVVLEYLKS